jgi:hypothetical protein
MGIKGEMEKARWGKCALVCGLDWMACLGYRIIFNLLKNSMHRFPVLSFITKQIHHHHVLKVNLLMGRKASKAISCECISWPNNSSINP